MAERLIVRSYARVFAVDRRIYRVDRWPVPVPGGVPLRAVVYFVATLVAMLLAGRLPGIGAVVDELTPPLRFVIVPLAVAMLGTQATPDGRSAHRFASAWLRLRLRARRRSAGRLVALAGEPVPWHGALPTAWDQHAPMLWRARICGPAKVVFTVPVKVAVRRGGRRLARRRGGGSRGQDVVSLLADEVLEVRR